MGVHKCNEVVVIQINAVRGRCCLQELVTLATYFAYLTIHLDFLTIDRYTLRYCRKYVTHTLHKLNKSLYIHLINHWATSDSKESILLRRACWPLSFEEEKHRYVCLWYRYVKLRQQKLLHTKAIC